MNIINIVQEGGIGDVIISLPILQNYFKKEGYIIHLYTSFPEIASFFLPFVKSFPLIKGINIAKTQFDYSIYISDIVYFHKKKDIILPDFIQEMYENWLNKYNDWQEILNKHPFKANEMAHKALTLGLNRYTLPFYFIGKQYLPYILPQQIKDIHIPKDFITIHDGFDATNYYKFKRSMKSWDIKYWEELIELFKSQYPYINVVQLGGVKFEKIKGVDINLAGQIEFTKSLSYLKTSLLHIDGDSGLIHARSLFNKRSITMFGPTNYKYFGYNQNINVEPNFCGDCWWKENNKSWMEKCMEGYDTPKCMDSIKPENIFKMIKNVL